MAWPTPQDYNEAVQSPQSSFSDPELKAGRVEEDKLGLPRPISGSFAVVYNMRCGPHNYAIRCFVREVSDQQERYAAISEHLKRARLSYTVGFEFLKEGIRVRGQWYPILKMEWISGQPLHTYIEGHLRDPAALVRLATNWITMTEALQKASLAHGDLQDGNVLVAGDDLKLIDYDGMFVPALMGKTSNENGHRNYQHPNRTAMDYGLFLDNFSNWVIYVSLVALAIDPSLWTRLKGGDECLLFRKEDFIPNGGSQALSALSQHPDPRLRGLGSVFESLIYLMPAQVPALATNSAVDPAALRQEAAQSQASSSSPSWLNDHVRLSPQSVKEADTIASHSSSVPISTASPTWILDFIKPVMARKSFDQPLLRLRLILATLLLLMLTLPLLGSVSADLVGESVMLTLLGALPFLTYRREPVAQERTVCLRREQEEQATLRELQRRVRDQDHQVSQLRDEEKKAKAAVERERETTRQTEQQAHQRASAEHKSKMDALTARQQQIARPLQKLQADYQASIARNNQQVANCNQQQVQEINTALQPLQRQFLQDYLRSARIDTARISGIGQKMAANLQASGFTTAADVTWNVQSVSGIGNNKASALMNWRQAVEAEARRKMPTSLSKHQVDAIVAKYEVQRKGLEQQAKAAKVHFEAQERTLKQQSASAVGAIDRERTAAQQQFGQQTQTITAQYLPQYGMISQKNAAIIAEYSKKVSEVEQQTLNIRKGIYDQNWQLAKARQELEVYQFATFAAYLTTILRVRRTRGSGPNIGP
jgi:hypothetical protein